MDRNHRQGIDTDLYKLIYIDLQKVSILSSVYKTRFMILSFRSLFDNSFEIVSTMRCC